MKKHQICTCRTGIAHVCSDKCQSPLAIISSVTWTWQKHQDSCDMAFEVGAGWALQTVWDHFTKKFELCFEQLDAQRKSHRACYDSMRLKKNNEIRRLKYKVKALQQMKGLEPYV